MPQHAVLPMHGRQHCPGGPDPIPCLYLPVFRAANLTHQITVPDNNEQELHFDTWEIPEIDGQDMGVFDVTLSSGRVRFIKLMKVGIYSLNCRVSWELGAGAIGEPDLTTIIMNDDYVNADKVTFGQTNESAGGGYCFSLTRSYPIFQNDDVLASATPPFATILWSVNQSSAGAISQDTDSFVHTSCEIIYLGGSNSFTPTYP